MFDLDLIIDHTDEVAKRLATKGVDPAQVHSARDSVLYRRKLGVQLDEARARMNRQSQEMGKLVAAKDPSVDARRAELAELKRTIANIEGEFRDAEQESSALLLRLPNLPHPEAPVGEDESANVVRNWSCPTWSVSRSWWAPVTYPSSQGQRGDAG